PATLSFQLLPECRGGLAADSPGGETSGGDRDDGGDARHVEPCLPTEPAHRLDEEVHDVEMQHPAHGRPEDRERDEQYATSAPRLIDVAELSFGLAHHAPPGSRQVLDEIREEV